MTVRLREAVDRGTPARMRFGRLGADGDIERCRLDVVAADVVNAVRFAGGLTFDMAMMGWEVRVLTADLADDRPLRILGARSVDLKGQLAPASRFPAIMAVAADLLLGDSEVRDRVLAALGRAGTEVTIWGEECPQALEPTDIVTHRLSTAARAFKAQALEAAGAVATSCDGTENFFEQSGESRNCWRG